MGKKFVNDDVSNINFTRSLNIASESKNDRACCSSCFHSNGECIEWAREGKCIKYNKYYSVMLPAFPIGCVNLKRKYFDLYNKVCSDYYIIEKLNENEFGVSFAYTTYDDELGENIVKVECNQDRLCLDELKTSKSNPESYFDSYNEKSTNYLYTYPDNSKFDFLLAGFNGHCDFWLDNKILEDNTLTYIFKYEDMFKILTNPNYNLKYAIFI